MKNYSNIASSILWENEQIYSERQIKTMIDAADIPLGSWLFDVGVVAQCYLDTKDSKTSFKRSASRTLQEATTLKKTLSKVISYLDPKLPLHADLTELAADARGMKKAVKNLKASASTLLQEVDILIQEAESELSARPLGGRTLKSPDDPAQNDLLIGLMKILEVNSGRPLTVRSDKNKAQLRINQPKKLFPFLLAAINPLRAKLKMRKLEKRDLYSPVKRILGVMR